VRGAQLELSDDDVSRLDEAGKRAWEASQAG